MAVTPQVEVIGPGAVSLADKGVLEKVAERRLKNGWGLADEEPNNYDALIAPSDCSLLGRKGWLLTNKGDFVWALVVDCEDEADKGIMQKHGLLVDTNRADLVHKVGWLVLIAK